MSAPTRIEHPSVEERRALGKVGARADAPSSHAGWEPAPTGPTRSRCSRSRTPPASPIWCRCATAG